MGDLSKRLQFAAEDGDDWSKLEDQKMRKRVQNRLAQRKRRSKRDPKAVMKIRECINSDPDTALETIEIVQNAHARVDNYGLSEHRFIRLAHYSTMRAVFLNANMLGLHAESFEDDDALSPWNTTYLNVADDLISAGFPPTLCPSIPQKTILHHPYIDILASSFLRDNILRANLSIDEEEELCMDLVSNGFSIWGSQPWNPMGWEVSQGFVDKWRKLIDQQTITFSNFWRFERGELGLLVSL